MMFKNSSWIHYRFAISKEGTQTLYRIHFYPIKISNPFWLKTNKKSQTFLSNLLIIYYSIFLLFRSLIPSLRSVFIFLLSFLAFCNKQGKIYYETKVTWFDPKLISRGKLVKTFSLLTGLAISRQSSCPLAKT